MSFQSYVNPGIEQIAPYQPGKPVETLERELGIKNSVKLASNENPLGPSKRLIEALPAQLGELARYPDGGCFLLKEALSHRFQVDPRAITVGNGSNDVLELLARIFLRPGLNAVVSQHAFVVYGLVTLAQGAEVREIPANNYGQDLEATLAQIDSNTRLVFIANPNNPTGTWVNRSTLETFLDAVPSSVIVVLDEAYFEYVDDPEYPDGLALMQRYSNLVVTRTFSKAYGLAGLRLGWSATPLEIADLMNRIRQPFNVNALAMAAGLVALEDQAHVQAGIETNRMGLRQVRAGVEAMGLSAIPSVGNFLSVEFQQDAGSIYEAMLREGVILRPVGVYGLPRHLRISIGTQAENERCLQALNRVLNA
ncbi:MAG: histidinol-phosphate transaminase [Pseudomonadales bacterium]